MLKPIRRHLAACPHKSKGVLYLKCNCPIHIHGTHNGKQVRIAADTRNMERAHQILRKIELGELDPARRQAETKGVSYCVTRFLDHKCANVDEKTKRKYRNALRQFQGFCQRIGRQTLDDVRVPDVDDYGVYRRQKLSALTWSKELQMLRSFFTWCMKREYCKRNPAREVEMPVNPQPEREIVPYTSQQVADILAACDRIGRAPYERLRAKAMVYVMRYTALAISDTIRLRRSQVIEGARIRLDRGKTGKPVNVPVPPEVVRALEAVPTPRNTPATGTEYFFWNGVITERALVGTAERTMAAVFAESGVPDAGTHRFRHTLATQLLEHGATCEDVAAILGNSAKIVEKHYGKWSKNRQVRLDGLLGAVHFSTPPAPETVYNDNRPVFTDLNWCGEGDLNPDNALKQGGLQETKDATPDESEDSNVL